MLILKSWLKQLDLQVAFCVMYVLCTAVNVVYRCNCCAPLYVLCVPLCGVLPFCIQLSSYHSVLRMLQCLCCIKYSIFCIYCALLCCTTNQYAFCVQVSVSIVCTIMVCVCCVLGLSWTTHEENTYWSLPHSILPC